MDPVSRISGRTRRPATPTEMPNQSGTYDRHVDIRPTHPLGAAWMPDWFPTRRPLIEGAQRQPSENGMTPTLTDDERHSADVPRSLGVGASAGHRLAELVPDHRVATEPPRMPSSRPAPERRERSSQSCTAARSVRAPVLARATNSATQGGAATSPGCRTARPTQPPSTTSPAGPRLTPPSMRTHG